MMICLMSAPMRRAPTQVGTPIMIFSVAMAGAASANPSTVATTTIHFSLLFLLAQPGDLRAMYLRPRLPVCGVSVRIFRRRADGRNFVSVAGVAGMDYMQRVRLT